MLLQLRQMRESMGDQEEQGEVEAVLLPVEVVSGAVGWGWAFAV